MKNSLFSDLIIRKARQNDLSIIQNLLNSLNLPIDGIEEHLSNFLVSESHGKIVGTIGLELYGRTALLRSAAVTPECQGKGIGDRLFTLAVEYAKQLGVQELVLLTTTAEGYFGKKGFSKVQPEAVRGDVRKSDEFRGACPSTAVVMKKNITPA